MHAYNQRQEPRDSHSNEILFWAKNGTIWPLPGCWQNYHFFNFFDTFGLSPWLLMLLNCKWLWACFSQVLPGSFLLWGHRDLWQLQRRPIHTFFCFISTKFLDTLVIQTRSATYGDTHLIANFFFLSFSIDFAVLKVNYSLASRLWLSRSLIGGFNRLGLLLAPGISFWRSMIPLIQLQCPHPTRISQLLAIVWVFSSSSMWFYHVGVSLSSTTVLIP